MIIEGNILKKVEEKDIDENGEFVIPDGVTEIENRAFFKQEKLRTIKNLDNIKKIGECAFGHCINLTYVNIPKSVIEIEELAFLDCRNLEAIEVDEDNLNYASLDGILYDKKKTILMSCPGKKIKVDIPEGVLELAKYSFSNCEDLIEVNIPSSVEKIPNLEYEEEAFSDCYELKNITVDKGNKHYSSQDGVLYDKNKETLILCPSQKTKLDIPEGVIKIAYNSFKNSKLMSINIPKSLREIEEDEWGEGIKIRGGNATKNRR